MSIEKSKSVSLRAIENVHFRDMCIELQVGTLVYRKSIPKDDVGTESVDYVVSSMLKTMLNTIAAEIGEQHKQLKHHLIKEKVCTS